MIGRPRYGSPRDVASPNRGQPSRPEGVDSDGLRYGAIWGRAQPVAIHTLSLHRKRKKTPHEVLTDGVSTRMLFPIDKEDPIQGLG